MNAPIAILTDFGDRDPFVGIMKGVILGINPSAVIVDVCHQISYGDVNSAAFALWTSFPFFPEGTVFLAVVDPGVGTSRRAIAVRLGGRTVVCPDNGVLSWVLEDHKIDSAVVLDKTELFLPTLTATFHGRDVFAPIAADLSKGMALEELGSPIEDVTSWKIKKAQVGDRSIVGEVVYIDRFGNLVTNIFRGDYEAWAKKPSDVNVKVQLGSSQIDGISHTYGDVAPGHAVAVWGSIGLLELAINGGSMEASLNAIVGSPVALYNFEDFK